MATRRHKATTRKAKSNEIKAGLPSGRDVFFKKITPLTYSAAYDGVNDADSDEAGTVKLICNVCTNPLFAPYPVGDSRIKKGRVSIEVLGMGDFLVLARKINAESGMTEAMEALREVDPQKAKGASAAN